MFLNVPLWWSLSEMARTDETLITERCNVYKIGNMKCMENCFIKFIIRALFKIPERTWMPFFSYRSPISDEEPLSIVSAVYDSGRIP